MNKLSRSIVAFLVSCLAVSITGCETPIAPMQATSSAPQRVEEKNYTIGETKTVYVGDPVVKFKDYSITRKSQNRLRASNSFTIKGVFVNFVGQKDQEFEVDGTTTLDGSFCYVIKLPSVGSFWPVKSTGEFFGKALNHGQFGGYENTIYSYKIDPPDTRFELVTGETVDKEAGFTNFELIYSGRNAQSLNFLYREYTSDDMARPAYSQALTYPADSKIVRFKKIRIGIEDVTDERIVYKVLEDSGDQ